MFVFIFPVRRKDRLSDGAESSLSFYFGGSSYLIDRLPSFVFCERRQRARRQEKSFGDWRRIKVEPFRQSRSDRSGLFLLFQPPVLSGGCFLFSFGCEPSPSAFWRWGAGKIRCGIAVSALLQRLGECRPWRCGSSVPPASRLHRVRAAARRRTARWKSPW